jgi:hypothetical protein
MLRVFASFAFIALLAACAASQSSPAVPQGTLSNQSGIARASGSCCNIFWNKKRLNLHYGGSEKAELTYWGVNGYYLYPVQCDNGGQITVTQGRTWGDPSQYEHTKFLFSTISPGPDRCSLTAVLNNTGSPPIAVIKLNIR